MTTLTVAAEFGKIWAKIIGGLAVAIGSLYGIAWLMFENGVIVNDRIASTADMMFMIVFPVFALVYIVAMVLNITWREAKWKLEKKERGWD